MFLPFIFFIHWLSASPSHTFSSNHKYIVAMAPKKALKGKRTMDVEAAHSKKRGGAMEVNNNDSGDDLEFEDDFADEMEEEDIWFFPCYS